MCGIAGWAGDVGGDREALRRMCAAISHRGPDAAGELFVPGEVALGFRRLAIIDLETGDQPLASEDAAVQVTCNGEIYNFRRLRAELESRGHELRSASDSEVIAHLYEERGADCLDSLQGMFAIALWDDRAKRLLLARDRMGVKPLYWAAAGDGILYASEPGAILASGLVEAQPDPRALLDYLTLQYVPAPRTGFLGIHKLAPGEMLVHEGGEPRIKRYWSLDFAKREPVADEEETLARLDTLLGEATRERLVADVPLGAFLSGGIDSSLVVAYMAEASNAVKTFSIDFPEAGFSEGRHARRVAELYGTEHENHVLEPAMVPLIADAVRYAGEPFADSSAIPTLLLSQVTRQQVTVALSGDGGDEAFAGYERYLAANDRPLLRAGARALARTGALSLLPAGRLRRRAELAALPERRRYAALMSHFAPADLTALCTPGFLAAAGDPETVWEETLVPPALAGVDSYLALDIETYLPGDLLLKVDRMSMSAALEVRSPILDYRVQELAAGMPGRMKLRGQTTKWALKELARQRGLPGDLVDRRKQGFGVPIGPWLRGELRPWVEDLLLDPRSLARGYFDPQAVRRLLQGHLDGTVDNPYKVWNLAVLEQWHRSWIDGD
jgi:asparagine synthase (glutamine-hydrolysing)